MQEQLYQIKVMIATDLEQLVKPGTRTKKYSASLISAYMVESNMKVRRKMPGFLSVDKILKAERK